MQVKFYLKDPNKQESIIVARILWQNYQLVYTAKKRVDTAFWVGKSEDGQRVQRVRETKRYPNYSGINQGLNNLQNEIGKVFIRYTNENQEKEPEPKVLKALLDKHLSRVKEAPKAKPVSFIQFLEALIARSEKGIRINRKTGQALSPNTIKTYRTTLLHLKEYSKQLLKPLDWIDINLDFHNQYSDYLIEEYDLSNNSIGKDFQIIKVICSEAYFTGINKYDQFKNPLFSVSREESFSIHLNDQEINLLWNLDLASNESLERTRDLFVLGCLIGQRHSDYSDIKSSQISGTKLYIKQKKSGSKVECSLLSPIAQMIIDRYQKNLPKGIVVQAFNRDLKEICKGIPEFKVLVEIPFSKGGKRNIVTRPKYEIITSHTARRSFATNEVEKGTPVPVIMATTGHTSEKSFWKYVKLTKSLYAEMYTDIMVERFGLKAV